MASRQALQIDAVKAILQHLEEVVAEAWNVLDIEIFPEMLRMAQEWHLQLNADKQLLVWEQWSEQNPQ